MAKKKMQLSLPVYKVGDDFQQHLEDSKGDVALAAHGMGLRYLEAAKQCFLFAGVIQSNPGLVEIVSADAHSISFDTTNPNAFKDLAEPM